MQNFHLCKAITSCDVFGESSNFNPFVLRVIEHQADYRVIPSTLLQELCESRNWVHDLRELQVSGQENLEREAQEREQSLEDSIYK